MTPSCPSSRRRSSGRWRRSTEFWEQEKRNRKDQLRRGDGKKTFRLGGNSSARKRTTGSRKMEGAMCDRKEIALHSRSSRY